jgi:hypothetical protein
LPSHADLESELTRLVDQGELLYYAMVKDLGVGGDTAQAQLRQMKLPLFKVEYDEWYSVAMRVVAQVLPDRLDDFVLQYKDPKRKEVTYLTYTISDYMLGLQTKRGLSVVANAEAAVPKMERQNGILRAAKAALSSFLVDLTEVLQADMFDSELDAAADLAKRGFVRGGGAIAGVVLEKHLAHVAAQHGFTSRKKHPTIADFNDFLKGSGVIDTSKWRFIQHLGDLRNLCDHPKERDPTKDDVAELVEGVQKVIKTVA